VGSAATDGIGAAALGINGSVNYLTEAGFGGVERVKETAAPFGAAMRSLRSLLSLP
jgi:hypothetical protein